MINGMHADREPELIYIDMSEQTLNRLYLSPSELICLTGRPDVQLQAEWLEKRRLPFTWARRRNYPLVGRRVVQGIDFAFSTPSEAIEAERAARIRDAFAVPATTYIYFIDESDDNSPVKIGRTDVDAVSRLAELQVGNPRRLRVIHSERAPFETEPLVHNALAAHRVCGEWFARTPVVSAFVEDCKRRGVYAALYAYHSQPVTTAAL